MERVNDMVICNFYSSFICEVMLRELALGGSRVKSMMQKGGCECAEDDRIPIQHAGDSVNSVSSYCRPEETTVFVFAISGENSEDIYF